MISMRGDTTQPHGIASDRHPTRDSHGPLRRCRLRGPGRGEQDHRHSLDEPGGSGRHLSDRHRARPDRARAPHGADAPRRSAERPGDDRARLCRLGAPGRLHRSGRPLEGSLSWAALRPGAREHLADRGRESRRLHRLGVDRQRARNLDARPFPGGRARDRDEPRQRTSRQLRLHHARLRDREAGARPQPVSGQDGRDRACRPAARPRRSPAHAAGNRAKRASGRVDTHSMKQIYPATITGKSFAPGGSVLEHRFGESDPFTLGVEEEYMLLDGETFDLVQHIDTVLADIAGHELEPRINPELMQSVLEIATPVCHTASDVEAELRKLRGYVTSVAHQRSLRVGSAGTHPFSLFESQRITARDRYRHLVDQLQYIARRELIFGLHIHVAVDDPEKAVQVVNGLLAHLGSLLALSANSPFWRGEPTGLASSRQMVFAAFPRSGPPPRFKDYADYAEVVGQLEKTGCIADYTHIWWDIRLHPRLGTIEIRVCDAVTRVEDAVALAAFCQALVKHYCERYDRGEEIPSYHRILTTENKWLAARYGLEAPVMDLATGRRNRVPVAQLVRRTLRDIEPHARELGSERELAGIREILGRGNGAERQRRTFNANRDLVEVVRAIADATEAASTAQAAA